MKPVEIAKNIYWVGAVDWNLRTFHGHTYSTRRGSTYNAYLIVDEKLTLVDMVHEPFTGEMIEKIREIADPGKIDYFIINHAEMDHTGSLPEMLRLCPGAKVFGTSTCSKGLQKYFYTDMDFQSVKTEDTLKIGKLTLTFFEVPMIHWPDSMWTYVSGEELLLSNDAFGQHYASSERYDDEIDETVLMDEAAKYYGNILWPMSSLILKKIDEFKNLNLHVKMIAPAHGIIWRSGHEKILDAYSKWAKNVSEEKAVIVYETMYGSTARMARKISEGLIDAGTKVKLFDINQTDITDIIRELLDARAYCIGSSTHDSDMLPKVAGFLHFLKGLRPKKRIGCSFGSFGWAGGAVKSIENIFKEIGIKLAQEGLSFKFAPDKSEIGKCYEFGKTLAEAIKRTEEK